MQMNGPSLFRPPSAAKPRHAVTVHLIAAIPAKINYFPFQLYEVWQQADKSLDSQFTCKGAHCIYWDPQLGLNHGLDPIADTWAVIVAVLPLVQNITKYYYAAQLTQTAMFHVITNISLWVMLEAIDYFPLPTDGLLWLTVKKFISNTITNTHLNFGICKIFRDPIFPSSPSN